MLWFKWLVTSFFPWRPEFDTRAIYVGFLENRVILGQFHPLLPVLWTSCVSHHSATAHSNLQGAGTTGPFQVALAMDSVPFYSSHCRLKGNIPSQAGGSPCVSFCHVLQEEPGISQQGTDEGTNAGWPWLTTHYLGCPLYGWTPCQVHANQR
jgi:hypothetical protein